MFQQSRREYRPNCPLWVAYVDLKAAFDRVDRNALWLLLSSSGLPPEIINLFKALYTDTLSCVRVDGYYLRVVPSTEWSQAGLRSGPRSLSESHGLVVRAHSTSRHGGHVHSHTWHTHPQTHPQTGPITIHCAAASAQCNELCEQKLTNNFNYCLQQH